LYRRVYHVQYGVLGPVLHNYFDEVGGIHETYDLTSILSKGSVTRGFAIIADAASIGSWFGTITGEMTHLETIPAFDLLGITRFLQSASTNGRK
jgi:hypothetical protein